MDILPKYINNICFFLHPKYMWPTLYQVRTDPLKKKKAIPDKKKTLN